MDGTLIDSGDVITNTINFVRQNLGLDAIPKDLMLKQLNNPDINSAEFFYGTSEFTPQQTELFTNYYDKYCTKDIKLYDGIYKLLERLSKKYILSVATNASSRFAKQMLKALNIDKFFNYVIGHDMVKNPKPAPDIILKTLDKLNIKQKDVILIGDSQKDKRAAKEAKIKFLPVNWGFSENNIDGICDIKTLEEKIYEYFNTNRY